jgi:excisionase family DNA binding protein
MSHVLTIEQAAAMLQLNPQVVREYLRKGKLPGCKIGRHWRILEEDLTAHLRVDLRPEQTELPENVRQWRALSREQKLERIRAVRGKYAHVPFSSDDLVKERHEEAEREESRWKERFSR